MSDCDHEVCLTCGDVAVEMRVVRLDGDLAVCEAADGDVRAVEVGAPRGGRAKATSCSSTPTSRWCAYEVRRRVPRRRARPRAGRRDPRHRRAGPPLQGDGGVRRAHALDLQVRDRRPAAGQRRARARARLPGLRDPDGPRRRRHRDRPPARRDLHLLRRHDARPGLERDAARGQGGGRRRADGLLAARRAADRQAEPRPRGRVLRDRLRDDCALDRAHAQARQGRGRGRTSAASATT